MDLLRDDLHLKKDLNGIHMTIPPFHTCRCVYLRFRSVNHVHPMNPKYKYVYIYYIYTRARGCIYHINKVHIIIYINTNY